MELSLSRRDDRILIEAADDGAARPVLPEVDTPTRHRGLLLVEDLSEEWGVRVHDDKGKVVWCEVPSA